jgi:hypothetical protein
MPRKKGSTNSKSKKTSKRGRRFRKIFDMELAYKVINEVQSSNEEYKIRLMDMQLAPVIENLIKDASLKFEKSEEKDSIIYRVIPGEVEFSKDILVEELEDEFLEKGQLF